MKSNYKCIFNQELKLMNVLSSTKLIIIILLIYQYTSKINSNLNNFNKNHNRNLMVGSYDIIFNSVGSILFWQTIKLNANEFIMCGNQILLLQKNGSSFTTSTIESGPEGRACIATSENEFIVSYWGGPSDRCHNKVFRRPIGGVFTTDLNSYFIRNDTGAAHDIMFLDSNLDYLLLLTFYSEPAKKNRICVFKRSGLKFDSYDSVIVTDSGNSLNIARFRNEYFIVTSKELSIKVFKISSDYKFSTNPIYQTITESDLPTAVISMDDNTIIFGFNNGKIKVYEFINNMFQYKLTVSTSINQLIYGLIKVNNDKFAAIYYVNGISSGTVIYVKQVETYIQFQQVIGIKNHSTRSIFLDDDLLFTNYNTGFVVYKYTCPVDSIANINRNCIHCLPGTVKEDNICKDKCYTFGNVPTIFNKCETCDAIYNGGSNYNRYDPIAKKCNSNCLPTFQEFSEQNYFICKCPNNNILNNGQCVPISNNSNCGGNGILNEYGICNYCPLTYEDLQNNKLYMFNGKCVSSCPYPFAKNESIINKFYCESCAEKNQYLMNNICVTSCNKRINKYKLVDIDVWECVESCNPSFFINQNSECEACPNDKLYVSFNEINIEICVNTCSSDMISNEVTKRCTKCLGNEIVKNKECYNCKNNNDDKRINFKNNCVNKCPDNFLYNEVLNTCIETIKDEIVKIPECPILTVKNFNQYSCASECDNFNGFFISNLNSKLCVKCQYENSYINQEEKKCVTKCNKGYGTDEINFIGNNSGTSLFICKKCEDLKSKKILFNDECVDQCPKNYKIVLNQCVALDLESKNCEGYCLNGGICSIKNNEPECNCINTKFIGKKCDTNLEIIQFYTEQSTSLLSEGKFKELFDMLESIPQIQTQNMLQLVYSKLNDILDDILSNKVPYNSKVFELFDSFKILSNK